MFKNYKKERKNNSLCEFTKDFMVTLLVAIIAAVLISYHISDVTSLIRAYTAGGEFNQAGALHTAQVSMYFLAIFSLIAYLYACHGRTIDRNKLTFKRVKDIYLFFKG